MSLRLVLCTVLAPIARGVLAYMRSKNEGGERERGRGGEVEKKERKERRKQGRKEGRKEKRKLT